MASNDQKRRLDHTDTCLQCAVKIPIYRPHAHHLIACPSCTAKMFRVQRARVEMNGDAT